MAFPHDLTRREFLRLFQTGALTLQLAWMPTCSTTKKSTSGGPAARTDDQLLEEIQRASFDFFWNEAGSATGQVKDRALAAGNDTRTVSSIAATGFALTALCIADRRGYKNSADIKERVRTTLRFLANQLPQEHGFFYHFVDMNTGARAFKCELSSIDTTILLCGVLTARQYFNDAEIQDLAYSSHPARKLGSVDAPDHYVLGHHLHLWKRSALHAPVFARLVRLSEHERRARKLFRELHQRHEGAQAFLPLAARQIR
jgi:hypothetical protein